MHFSLFRPKMWTDKTINKDNWDKRQPSPEIGFMYKLLDNVLLVTMPPPVDVLSAASFLQEERRAKVSGSSSGANSLIEGQDRVNPTSPGPGNQGPGARPERTERVGTCR